MWAWALLLKCSIVSYVDRPLVISSSSSSRSSLYWKEKSYSCRGEPSGVWVWQLFALRAKAEKDFYSFFSFFFIFMAHRWGWKDVEDFFTLLWTGTCLRALREKALTQSWWIGLETQYLAWKTSSQVWKMWFSETINHHWLTHKCALYFLSSLTSSTTNGK